MNDPFVGVIQFDVDDETIRTFLSSLVNSQAFRFQVDYAHDRLMSFRRHIFEDSPRLTPTQYEAYVEDQRHDHEDEIEREVQRRVAEEKKKLSEADRTKRRG